MKEGMLAQVEGGGSTTKTAISAGIYVLTCWW